ncbi:16S rRNA (cytidine(1402)-2'-O)-methyltransferase [Parazoarcus communis]
MTDPVSLAPLMSSSLYVVATPLGNLGDISQRALDVLRGVDIIAAEDTRHSQRLLDAFGIRVRLTALHQHNEQKAADQLVHWLAEGKRVALISDAGTPAISDPGARAVARVRQAGFAVVPVPGACAAVAALSVSGFAEGGFRFVGFLPPKSAARLTVLSGLVGERDALVFYEAPHRVVECVTDMLAAFGAARELLVAREMTKLHEEIVRLPLGEAVAWFAADDNRVRGEFVLVVQGAPEPEGLSAEAERVLGLLLAELPLKTAARLAADISGEPKNALYARALVLKRD